MEGASNPAAHAPVPTPVTVAPTAEDLSVRKKDVNEFKARLLALPAALIVARLVLASGFGFAVRFITMVLHESGHAITSWLTGRWAVPLLWVTYHGENRSWLLVLALMGAFVFGGVMAWRAKRWGWVCAAAAALVLQLRILSLPAFTEGALIVFGGDGGALVLSTILMTTFYAPRDSALYKSWGLRWGLMAFGAMCFMDVFHIWTGPYGDIPWGEIEGVNFSDPSLLTEMYGWSITQVVDRYVHLATFCLIALAVVYAWGLFSAYPRNAPRQ